MLLVSVSAAGCSGRFPASGACPDLAGRYAIAENQMLEARNLGGVPGVKALEIENGTATDPTSGYRVRWLFDDAAVRANAERLEASDRERYKRWYGLLYGELGARRRAKVGADALAREIVEVAPVAEYRQELSRLNGYRCQGGDLTVGDVRVRREGATLVHETTHYTYRRLIDVWCGDGCSGINIPTSRHVATVTWPSSPLVTPWSPDADGMRASLPQPTVLTSAEGRFYGAKVLFPDAPPVANIDEIRRRVQALGGPGTLVARVELGDGAVVTYDATRDGERHLLDALRAADGTRVQVVDRGPGRYGVRTTIRLPADSPLVAP